MQMFNGGNMPPLPPIPGHERLAPLGRGGMGEVWRAVETATGRTVALKFIAAAPAGSSVSGAARLARFEQEMEFAARLEHPGIPQFHTHGLASDGTPFFTMELIEGEPLETRAAAHCRTPRDVLTLFLPVCEAIAHAHQRGVIHRDLKPANILVTAAGQPKVLDFGLAKTLDPDSLAPALSHHGDLLGTPLYMSPEQAAGDTRKVGTPSDVWALGIILHRLLTGTHPFPSNGTTAEILARILRPDAIRLSRESIPDRDLVALAGKCLAFSPADRYPNADALAADVRAWLAGKPITAREPGALELTWRFLLRHRYAAAAAAIVLTSAIVFITWYAAEKKRTAAAREATLFRARELVDHVMGDMHARLEEIGRSDLAEDAMREAAGFAWDLPGDTEAEGKPDTRRFLALSATIQARALTKKGDFAQALPLWREAAAALDALLAAQPRETFRRDAAAAHEGLGRVLWLTGASHQGLAELLKAAALQEPDLREVPDAAAAEVRIMAARLLLRKNRAAEALPLLQPALDAFAAAPASETQAALHARLTAWWERCRLQLQPDDPAIPAALTAAAERLQPWHTGGGLPAALARSELHTTRALLLLRTGLLLEAMDTLQQVRPLYTPERGLVWDDPLIAARVDLGETMLLLAREQFARSQWEPAGITADNVYHVFQPHTGDSSQYHPGGDVLMLYQADAKSLSADCARQRNLVREEGNHRFAANRLLRRYHSMHPDDPDRVLLIAEGHQRLHLLQHPLTDRGLPWRDRIPALLKELERHPGLTAELLSRRDALRLWLEEK